MNLRKIIPIIDAKRLIPKDTYYCYHGTPLTPSYKQCQWYTTRDVHGFLEPWCDYLKETDYLLLFDHCKICNVGLPEEE